MKLAIIGSRKCSHIDIASHLPFMPDVIISGGAIGVDTYAKEYAIQNGIIYEEYLPDYSRFGRSAPILRDIEIVRNCDYLLAFWNGESKGTKFTIEYAQKFGKPVRIIRI